jgi:hypothetical protein
MSNILRGKPRSRLLTPWRTSSAVSKRCRILPSPLRAPEFADGRSIRSRWRHLPGEASQERRRKGWEQYHPHPRGARSCQESRRLQRAAWPRNGLAPPVAREAVRERGVPDRSLEQGDGGCFETCFEMNVDEVVGREKGKSEHEQIFGVGSRNARNLREHRARVPSWSAQSPHHQHSSSPLIGLIREHNHARQKSEGPLRRR